LSKRHKIFRQPGEIVEVYPPAPNLLKMLAEHDAAPHSSAVERDVCVELRRVKIEISTDVKRTLTHSCA